VRETLAIAAGVVVTLWGIAHAIPTRAVVAGFGEISEDNRRVITQEWLAEAFKICPFLLATTAAALVVASFI